MQTFEERFFDGKVTLQSLPVTDGTSGHSEPLLKRMLLAKGELAQFHDSDWPMHYIAFIELRPGRSRGNHYHMIKQEHVYLICGRIQLRLKDIHSGACAVVEMITGSLVQIEPGIAHVLRPLSMGQAIEFSPTRFNPRDTYPADLETP